MCEEDEIINRLRESRSDGEMFFDVEFGGVATALYENESEVPEYDQDLSEPVVWLRPQELAHSPEYFVDGALSGSVVEGRLGDGWLLGAMAAISGPPELLVENLFGRDPDDFKKWGELTTDSWVKAVWERSVPLGSTLTSNKPIQVPRENDRAIMEVMIDVLDKCVLSGSIGYGSTRKPCSSRTFVQPTGRELIGCTSGIGPRRPNTRSGSTDQCMI